MRHSCFLRASRYDGKVPIEDMTGFDPGPLPNQLECVAAYLRSFLADLGEHSREEDFPVAHITLEIRSCRKPTAVQALFPELVQLTDQSAKTEKPIGPFTGT
jgi:hypothetical protein